MHALRVRAHEIHLLWTVELVHFSAKKRGIIQGNHHAPLIPVVFSHKLYLVALYGSKMVRYRVLWERPFDHQNRSQVFTRISREKSLEGVARMPHKAFLGHRQFHHAQPVHEFTPNPATKGAFNVTELWVYAEDSVINMPPGTMIDVERTQCGILQLNAHTLIGSAIVKDKNHAGPLPRPQR